MSREGRQTSGGGAGKQDTTQLTEQEENFTSNTISATNKAILEGNQANIQQLQGKELSDLSESGTNDQELSNSHFDLLPQMLVMG